MDTILVILLVLVSLLAISQLALLYLISRSLTIHDEEVRTGQKTLGDVGIRSNEILHSAIKQAEKITTEAELTGIHLLSEGKITNREYSERYRKHLEEVEKALRSQFDTDTKAAEAHFSEFITSVSEQLQQHIAQNDKLLDERSKTLVEEAGGLIETFTKDVQGKFKTQIDDELSSAKKEIDDYKAHRIRVIDERIVDMLEEIVRVALEKKMSLVEQSELVYKALDEAKRENAFAFASATPIEPRHGKEEEIKVPEKPEEKKS